MLNEKGSEKKWRLLREGHMATSEWFWAVRVVCPWGLERVPESGLSLATNDLIIRPPRAKKWKMRKEMREKWRNPTTNLATFACQKTVVISGNSITAHWTQLAFMIWSHNHSLGVAHLVMGMLWYTATDLEHRNVTVWGPEANGRMRTLAAGEVRQKVGGA